MIGNEKNLKSYEVTSDAAKNAEMKVLISPTEGWEGYVMREVILGKDGYSPEHQHPWPHINYVIEGQGKILMGDKYQEVSAGSYAFVPGNTLHQYRNTGQTTFRFICIVPEEGHKI